MWEPYLTNTAKIIAEKVHNHQIFGLIFFRSGQIGGRCGVSCWILDAGCSPLNGASLQITRPGSSQKALWRGAAHLPVNASHPPYFSGSLQGSAYSHA
jgi:hypothetical protein